MQDAGLLRTAVRGRHRRHEPAAQRLVVVERWTTGLAARHAAVHTGAHAQEERR